MYIDIAKISTEVYLNIIETDDIPTLLALKKRYSGKRYIETRKAIDYRIQNIRHKQ
ncbi:hypothetical protein L0P88_03955 [Muricauda sp. SCSIO 64092]|uniref:hypothetical protein n=1 Tax=Allomuricauda sp. SCSIO 64092 TaxID=2908842 RepID=UPI001FF5164F|nr:hypothetical protein [Muricauda sp. SCSIO 64092]UOY07708.1 hypothetical protein L0P88_03955 [Muricauda sp. SCSIO 64092]